MSEHKCIFCEIINGNIGSDVIYEDGDFIAFLDINPVSHGHTLLVPKKHSINILDTDEAVLSKLSVIVKKVSKAILQAMDSTDFNLEVNNGKNAGQLVPHSHWHIIPRWPDDGLKPWPGKKYEEGEAVKIAKRIKDNIV